MESKSYGLKRCFAHLTLDRPHSYFHALTMHPSTTDASTFLGYSLIYHVFVVVGSCRDLKPHNILLAAIERKGQGLGTRNGGARSDKEKDQSNDGEVRGEAEGAPRKLTKMDDVASFVLKISDMGLGKQLLNGQSR